MSQNPQQPLETLTTLGIGHFGESGEQGKDDPLFRIVPGHSLEHALEQATVLICTVHQLSDLALTETKEGPALITAVHYLTGMAKALAEDLSYGVTNRSLGQ